MTCIASADAAVADSQATQLIAFDSPELESRYYQLIDELRCPKCQNQNLADSDAPIAADLKKELHRLLHDGQTDQQILDFMTARYGTFVRYQPPVNWHTAALWLLPLAALSAGFWLMLRLVARGDNTQHPGKADTLQAANSEDPVSAQEDLHQADIDTKIDALLARDQQRRD